MVDLGQVRAVTAVKIWNRGDCCSDRLQGFDVRIGNSASSYSTATVCFTGGTAPLTSPYTVQVDCEGSGRYLYIGVPGSTDPLSLCEVEVYGPPGGTHTHTHTYTNIHIHIHVHIHIHTHTHTHIHIHTHIHTLMVNPPARVRTTIPCIHRRSRYLFRHCPMGVRTCTLLTDYVF